MMVEGRAEKKVKVAIAIANEEEYLIFLMSEEEAREVIRKARNGYWLRLKDEYGFEYEINPRFIAYIKHWEVNED